MEGHFLGVQSIAFSLVGKVNFTTAAKIAKRLAVQHLSFPVPTNRLLNVNVPDVADVQSLELEVTRLGARHHASLC